MIQFSHVYKTYADTSHALRNVSFIINKGEFIFLTGPSGAGKSTLFRILSAYDKPTTGDVDILGYNIKNLTQRQLPYLRRQVGMVFQDFKLLKNRTVFDNIALPLEILKERRNYITKRVREMLDQVGLTMKTNDYPEFLSGGEQQRVAIARALVHRPGILIADEPTGNLDPELSLEIMELFEAANAQGTTVFIATHDLDLIKGRHKHMKLNSGVLSESNNDAEF